jgi:hypothetical protein
MSTTTMDPRIDRLYKLLPAIYRIRDTQQQYTLQALLRVIAEQVNVVEDDIAQLYENWFIETAQDWAVPYIADLIGYRPVLEAGSASDDSTAKGRALNRVLIPRREVANTIRYRRRKGILGLLPLLANDVSGWPARAVEFFKRLGWNQNINHRHPHRARTVDLHHVESLDLIDGPFDPLAHTVDIHRVNSHRTVDRYNIPSIGVFVWRLKSYPVTRAVAHCAEDVGPQCFTFSVLGQDAPLFIKPQPQTERSLIAEELSVPARIRRFALDRHLDRFYGPELSLAIWVDDALIPLNRIVPADLSHWRYAPQPQQVAVDPVLGRFVFPVSHLPRRNVRVSYHYGFSADIGGGEYNRPLLNPVGRRDGEPNFYRVGGSGQEFHRISDALAQWQKDEPLDAVIEIADSGVYVEQIAFTIGQDRTLQLRAANRRRPIIRMIDWQTDQPDALSVTMSAGSRFTLDGLLITGRPVQISGPQRDNAAGSVPPICGSQLVIRHCTLVPGWGINCDCEPDRPAEPSLELFNVRARLHIHHSIVGAIQINEDEVKTDPIPVSISDSILDATDLKREAIGAPGMLVAHAVLSIERATVFGIIDVRAIEAANDSIFMGCVNVARRQLGCMRFCYVPAGCRTPRRYNCQPDGVVQAAIAALKDPTVQAAVIAKEQLRVIPQFNSSRYGQPGYAQLSLTSAVEIRRGAEDESEMGVFHDLFQPQREANLRARLNEYSAAGMDAGIIFAT